MNVVMFLVSLIAAGVIGAFLVNRRLRGKRAAMALLVWIATPYVLLGCLGYLQSGNELQFWLGAYAVMLSIVWLPAILLGAMIGLRPTPKRSLMKPD